MSHKQSIGEKCTLEIASFSLCSQSMVLNLSENPYVFLVGCLRLIRTYIDWKVMLNLPNEHNITQVDPGEIYHT